VWLICVIIKGLGNWYSTVIFKLQMQVCLWTKPLHCPNRPKPKNSRTRTVRLTELNRAGSRQRCIQFPSLLLMLVIVTLKPSTLHSVPISASNASHCHSDGCFMCHQRCIQFPSLLLMLVTVTLTAVLCACRSHQRCIQFPSLLLMLVTVTLTAVLCAIKVAFSSHLCF